MQEHSFSAGAAQVDITPPLGTVINGEFTNRYANNIADPLFAKALVLQQGKTTLLIIMVDICAMQRDFLDEVKTTISHLLGIPCRCQLIAATHTHSAGSVAELLMGHIDWAYRRRLRGLIVDAAKAAFNNLEPAKIGWGAVDQPQHLLCRRYEMDSGFQAVNPVTGGRDEVKTNPFGNEHRIVRDTTQPDPGLGYLAIQAIDGRWLGLLANYSLHYVGDCDRGTISADYFGYFAKAVAIQLGADEGFVGLMSNGTSGEINIWDFQHPDRYPKGNHEKSRLIGGELAAAVAHSLQRVSWESSPSLAVRYTDFVVGLRKPSVEELPVFERIVRETDYETISFGNERFFEQVYAREQVLLAEYPDEKPFPVQSFRIGQGAIGALGGEFFSETGLKLKSTGPSGKYFTICLANDYVGYVPPAHELARGGYECWRCRTSHLAVDAEEKIRTILAEQLADYGVV
ncbi:MAG TPA: hypothetical protein VNQ80_14225 [Parapedobacter sp.]|uniref:hypothetical protein n=1 Tax=Parapedobacter sp. TaxID=1958893 RepID=UPI002C3D6998|nr:hypothetical protein [Parapedobacter sp.]HWK58497.1 hypothetical protein [Parapedobacter sp.]